MKEYNANLPQVFNYMGNKITFLNGESVIMINATEMAKPFNKSPWKWLELPSTKEYIRALSENRSLAENQLVTSVRGGNKPEARGNWFHEDLALEFARWLSPAFAIWCNDRIKELLRHGATALNPESLLDPDYVIKVMTALKKERAEKELAQSQVREMAPKALFADAVSASSHSCLIGELAKLLKQNGIEIGQNRLFKWLRSHGYLGVKGEYRNLPTQRAIEMGLFEIKKTTINRPDGTILVSSTTKVTGKGQIYFVNKFLRDGAKTIPVSE